VLNHEVVLVDLGLVDIGVYHFLVYRPFVRLRDDRDEIVQQNDNHKHGLKDPNQPNVSGHQIFISLRNLPFINFFDPVLVIWLFHVSYGVSHAVQEVAHIFMDIAILVLCVDFEDHECNREEACVQEKEEQKRD
jgi:hypothetical protein